MIGLSINNDNKNKKVIYTIGSSTRSIEEFISLLQTYKIEVLIDTRRFPTSSFPHFKKENLQKVISESGITYIYLGKELGGFRPGGYKEYIHTTMFKKGLTTLEEIAKDKVIAIMCAERLPWRCHRRFIGKELEARNWKVLHIIDHKHIWEAKNKNAKK